MSKKVRTLRVVSEAPAASAPARPTHGLGRLVRLEAGRFWVECDDALGPRPARSTLGLDAAAMRAAVEQQREALLVFEDDQADRPVVIGLLDAPDAHEVQAPRTAAPQPEGRGPALEALVDGKRVVIEAQDEIVLRCGEASITLRRNGRLIVRGTYVETRSRGVNRIKGGSVQIN